MHYLLTVWLKCVVNPSDPGALNGLRVKRAYLTSSRLRSETSRSFWYSETSFGITSNNSDSSDFSLASDYAAKNSTVDLWISSISSVQSSSVFPSNSLLICLFLLALTIAWKYDVFLFPSFIHFLPNFSFQKISSYKIACWQRACNLLSLIFFSKVYTSVSDISCFMMVSSASLTLWVILRKTFLFHHSRECFILVIFISGIFTRLGEYPTVC